MLTLTEKWTCVSPYSMVFATLYQLISFGHDGSGGDGAMEGADAGGTGDNNSGGGGGGKDSPQDSIRVRLVCSLLETCGQYFDRGPPKRTLDRFLVGRIENEHSTDIELTNISN